MSNLKDFFKLEDFSLRFLTGDSKNGYLTLEAARFAADRANVKLQKEIESWPVVYGRKGEGIDLRLFSTTKDEYHTHTARLAFIEEIKKECVNHEPTWSDQPNKSIVYFAKCIHCGVELQANWSEK